jgi:hypothetical protein
MLFSRQILAIYAANQTIPLEKNLKRLLKNQNVVHGN